MHVSYLNAFILEMNDHTLVTEKIEVFLSMAADDAEG